MNKRFSPRRVALVCSLFALVAAAVFVSPSSSGQGGTKVRQDVAQALSSYDELTLDPSEAARQVRETGRLTLRTARGTFELELEPYDVRAPNYRAVAMEEGGVARDLGRAPSRTFKGTVRGMEGAQARFSIDGQKLEGLIATTGGEVFFVEPAKNFSSAAGKGEFVFYPLSAVRAESFGECGTTLAHRVGERAASVTGGSSGSGATANIINKGAPEELFGPMPEVELATEADNEYVDAAGGVNIANLQIADIVNQIDGIYQTQLGIRIRIVFQRGWATADPYSGTDASAALNQFRTTYDGTFAPGTLPARDLTHMWTGRNFNGGTVGIAYIAAVCDSPAFSYGMSQDAFAPDSAHAVVLTAHEIGHNFSAEHPNEMGTTPAGCPNTIMHASVVPNLNFCQFSRDQITDHTTREDSCLSRLSQPGCTYAVTPGYRRFGPGGGTDSLNVSTNAAGCDWAVGEGAPWLNVTSGAGVGPGSATYNVAPNAGGPVSALVDIAGQKVRVVQDASANCQTAATDGNDSGELTTGDCLSGQLYRPSTFADLWTFQGVAGQRIRITMSASVAPNLHGTGVDTFLYLFGPNGTVIAENDDIILGQNTNSQIPVGGFGVLPQTGTYTIVATSFDDTVNDLGAYSLVMDSGVANNNVSIAGGGQLSVSEGTAPGGVATEGTGMLTVSVSRSTTAGPASVDYATSDGTASSKSDYTAAIGTLHFADGEQTKTFTVHVTDDRFDDNDETVNITLSNPSGMTLSPTAATAVLTISDNDTANGPSPVREQSFDTRFFVRQHYLDFLGREPDQGGMNFWSNGIDLCGPDAVCHFNKRIDTSAAFFLSIEFQETGFLVQRMYKTAYGEADGTAVINSVPTAIKVPVVRFNEFLPDSQRIARDVIVGTAGWPERLAANKAAFALEFVQRSRFTTAFAGLTPEQFVDRLITNTGITIEAGERQALINELTANNNAAGRASVLRQVAENEELADIETNKAFVLMQYFGYLRRNPNDPQDTDHSGYNFWLRKLNDNGGDFRAAQMVFAFLDSIEYKQRFGNP
jgi:Metallo-peptidase family M12/Calx-beta domain/Bacterial pre-peptidase C-terminal domain